MNRLRSVERYYESHGIHCGKIRVFKRQDTFQCSGRSERFGLGALFDTEVDRRETGSRCRAKVVPITSVNPSRYQIPSSNAGHLPPDVHRTAGPLRLR
jgi:hypothetical protein